MFSFLPFAKSIPGISTSGLFNNFLLSKNFLTSSKSSGVLSDNIVVLLFIIFVLKSTCSFSSFSNILDILSYSPFTSMKLFFKISLLIFLLSISDTMLYIFSESPSRNITGFSSNSLSISNSSNVFTISKIFCGSDINNICLFLM